MTKRTEGQDARGWPSEEFSSLYCLTYCSRAAASVDEIAISQIVSAAQQFNRRQGITGLLVFSEGVFLQWIEGPKEQVAALMSRILQDPRHTDVHVFSAWEDVRERLFPNWAMEHVRVELICDVLAKALNEASDVSTIQALRSLLKDLNTGGLAALTLH